MEAGGLMSSSEVVLRTEEGAGVIDRLAA